MITFRKQAAQGDLLITRIQKLPKELTERKPEDGRHILAHSETGHHHVVDAEKVHLFKNEQDSMICYLSVTQPTELFHLRSFNTHAPIALEKGVYEIRRQREYVPEGWRRVED
ncbi:MAG: hypothetical protein HQM14_19645 [SAR324 cluster bacterium]|nr:hypothetical protein [SAR324 cluster bacterium]